MGSNFAQLVDLVGKETAEVIRGQFAGEFVYIPIRGEPDRDAIKQDFEVTLPGSASVMAAYETVAERYGLSARTIMRIVNW